MLCMEFFIFCDIAVICMLLNTIDYKSTMVQVMASSRQAPDRYMDQLWSTSVYNELTY